MWTNTAKWLQERAQEVAQKAEEVRSSRVVSDLESHGKTFLQALVAPGFANDAFGDPRDLQEKPGVVLHYITDRIVGMALPNPVDEVASLLAERHAGHFMIWNISEDTYDYTKFENQVLEFKFPGHPAPPLGLLVKMCTSIENWLQADKKNVAIVHCLTGKGRTSTVLAALLCWLGWDVGQGTDTFQNITTMQALQYVADRMGLDLDKVTIPSQRRYLQYFNNMVDGIKPRTEPLILRRVIMNSIPRFGTAPPRSRTPTPVPEVEGAPSPEPMGEFGCCPYLQLFKGGKLIFTSPCSRNGSVGQPTAKNEAGITMLPWAFQSDGSIIFVTDCVLQGDILLRARHLSPNGQKVSMFRAAFHTGYVPCGVLRLSKAHLDGACTDSRFEDDFFIDLIFDPIEGGDPEGTSTPSESSGGGGETTNAASQRRGQGVPANIEDKDSYDAMLHKDTRFWKEIAARKRRAAQRARLARMEKEEQGGGGGAKANKFSIAGDDDAEGGLIVFDNTPRMLESSLDTTPKSTNASTKPVLSSSALMSDDALLQELQEAEGDSFTTAPPPPVVTKVDSTEINALHELEKELGLEFLGGGPADAVTPSGNTAPTSSAPGGGSAEPPIDLGALDLDENLEEFESFLKDLDGGKGNGGAS